MRLVMELNHEELNSLQTPIIVESWDKVVGRGICGSKRRRWLAEFTEAERKLISYYYPIFYRWYLVKGTPQKHVFRKVETIDLIKKAVCFFASV